MKHTPRKRFGQHFLVDEAVLAELVHHIDPQAGQVLVEVGPGPGALTHRLLAQGARLTAIELDRDLARALQGVPGLHIICADVLTVDFAALSTQLAGPLRVVGNLPYNISTPILFHLDQAWHCVHDMHFMLQKEVVQRMVAPVGDAAYGRLSVMLQWRWEMEMLMSVPPEAFDPPPAVNSAVVRLLPRATERPVDQALLSEVVAVAFSQRRKLLRHTLGPWLQNRAAPGVAFDLQRRAQEVSVQQYLQLVLQLQAAAAA